MTVPQGTGCGSGRIRTWTMRRHPTRACPAVHRQMRIRTNTVYLSAHDPDLGLGRRGLATVLGPCHVVARHLAFDGAWVVARMSRREGLEEQFGGSPALRVVKYLRGKNPGATPRCGAPPGGPA